MQDPQGAGLPTALPFPRRPLAPLAATLGLHLLLVLAWLGGAAHKPIGPAPRPEPVFVLVQPLASPQPVPATRQALPEPRPRPGKRAEAATAAVPTPATPMPRPTPKALAQPRATGQAAAAHRAPEPVPDSAAASAAPPASAPGDLFATSKAMAGPVDRALRNGASPTVSPALPHRARLGHAPPGAACAAGIRRPLLEQAADIARSHIVHFHVAVDWQAERIVPGGRIAARGGQRPA